ncbi:hypothetical protein [Paenibacillus sp.]|uniref:hypothetical protein n=1 Tax=Paenibacillus sp. TaxID=58172 RepID=UPI002D6AE57E|nr:hypothetical protein [Paenibacillus sp.]HZG86034.1 hypothetical protein [Paenibacillus sp.]
MVFIFIAMQLPKLRGMTRWLTTGFAAIGAILLAFQKATAWQWFEAAGMNVTIVTLFLFAPLFGIPVRIPDYVASLKRFYQQKLRSKTELFVGTQLLTQIMGVFINVGSIPVVYELVFVRPRQGMSRLLANALNRGFAGAILWSPYFAAMALVTTALALPWSSVLPSLLGLAVLSLVVSWAVDVRELSLAETEPAEHEPAEREPAERESAARDRNAAFPFGLAAYLAAAMIVVLALERAVELPMAILICLAAVVFPLIWCVGKRALPVYRSGLKTHLTVTVPALQKEMTLFLAAGFFSGAIGTTGFGAAVPALLEHIPLLPISFAFSLFAVALIAGSSLIGLHPIVPVAILASGIDPPAVGMSPTYFAVLLLGSWGLSNPISPASAVNNLLAGLFQKPVLELASRNYRFAGWMAIALLIYVTAGSSIAGSGR